MSPAPLSRRSLALGTVATGALALAGCGSTTLITSLTVAPYTHLWKTSTAGSYSLTAKATDSTGKTTTSAAVPVTVVTNQAPTVNLTSPAASQNVRTGALLTLTADAQDSDGTLAKVAFYRGTTLIGTLTAAPYTYTWKTGTVGSYSLTAKATDDNGKVAMAAAAVLAAASPAATVDDLAWLAGHWSREEGERAWRWDFAGELAGQRDAGHQQPLTGR